MILPVSIIGSSVLRKVAKDIDKEYENLSKLIEDMFETMYESDGVGLAAPQVGIFKRFFIMKDFRSDSIQLIINPVITKVSDKIGTFREGCLTYPGEEFIMKRPKQIWAEWYNLDGMLIRRKLTGKESQVFCHEYDHLDGITCKNKA